MNDQLIHILDHSACLSRRQVRDYLAGTMEQEEQHAVELHVIACPLCGLAMEGFENRPGDATASLAGLDAGFLKDHFDKMVPQIHLNSISPAYALSSASRKRAAQGQPVWKHVLIIGSLLTVFALLWYFEFGQKRAPKINSAPAAALETTPAAIKAAPASVSAPAKPQSQKVHPADEALIREAKAASAGTSAEPQDNDDELNRIFEESQAQSGMNEPAHGTLPPAAAPGTSDHKDSSTDPKTGSPASEPRVGNPNKSQESADSGDAE